MNKDSKLWEESMFKKLDDIKFDVRSLYPLTRSPRTKKARESGELSVTAQSEIKTIVKRNILVPSDRELESSYNNIINKIKDHRVRLEAVNMVVQSHPMNIEYPEGGNFIEGHNLYGYYDLYDPDSKSLHLITLPYTVLDHFLTGDEIVENNNFKSREYRSRGLMMIMNENGNDVDNCYIHSCFVDTPEEYIDNDPILHQWNGDVCSTLRLTTTNIQRDLEIEEEIQGYVERSKKYYEEYCQSILENRGK